MENTGKLLFEDQTPQWYVALGKNWIGPLTAADVYAKVIRQDVTWAHYVWRKGQKNWQRICDTQPFEAAVPHEPSKAVQQEVVEKSRELEGDPRASIKAMVKKRPPAPPKEGADADQKVWYLYYSETQFGPFSMAEVEENLASGMIDSKVYAWRDGMSGWERLEKIEAFQKKLKKSVVQPATLRSVKPASEKKDMRGAPRKPMLAKILLSNDQDVAIAVCRDISIGGMQVLTDKIPGEVGAKIKLNVSPTAEELKSKKPSFKAFVAEGTIVRLLEDGRGFSFRFSRLTESARRSIESYIQSK
jgi:hypothetical protein